MPPQLIFSLHVVLGYLAWMLCFAVYLFPRLAAIDKLNAQRAIATLHSFRFFGLVFLLPGFVGHNLPASFATSAAYGDFATGILALLALLTVRARPLFWFFVTAFNLTGAIDLVSAYYHGSVMGLPALSGELGAAYPIVILYVPVLMITHVFAFYLLIRPKTLKSTDAEIAQAANAQS